MKGLNIISRIVFSSWFLAIFPALLLCLFLPSIGEKYSLLVEHSQHKPLQMVYADLNGDSITECLLLESFRPYNHISIMDNQLHYYDQWNFPDSIVPTISNMFIGNYDHDRFAEIYVFTVNGDSLFLNMNEFFDPSGTRMQHIFITKIGLVDGVYTSTLYVCGLFDENGDGKDELYFSIATGFGLEPRRMYSYDIANKKLKISDFTGYIFMNSEMKDIDGDNRPEFFGIASASGNYKTKTPYPDYSCWLMIYNDHLQFKFPPVEFPGFANGLYVIPSSNNSEKKIIAIHQINSGVSAVLKSKIMLFSTQGQLIKSRFLSDYGNKKFLALKLLHQNQSDQILLISERLQSLNENLAVLHSVKLPFVSDICCQVADLLGDGNEELLLYSQEEEKLIAYNSNLSKIVEKTISLPISEWRISYLKDKNQVHKPCISVNGNAYLLTLSKNPYFLLGYLEYPGIYLFFFFFILLVRKISTYQLAKTENLKRRLISLQLQSIKSQLDPHFAFNALNSIASLIYEEDRQSAYDHMNKFTQLLRRMLNDADRIYRSLKEELEFVNTYLDLEKLRFGDKFKYEINIGAGISLNEQVPKMVLQTFAENAFKHGIMPSADGGILIIQVEKEKDYLRLTIEDNGIGRIKAAGHNASTGKGLKISAEFYEILNQINKHPILHNITDLYNESGQPAGTRVEVWVPRASLE
jgi:hypothetical protein